MPEPDQIQLHCGDCLTVLAAMKSQCVQCVVTSPPYWGLRDYGTATWKGGNPTCNHRQPATGGNPEQGPNKGNNNAEAKPYRDICGKCGAKRIDAQLGLEETHDEYVAKMVDIFREVRRVLRDDGALWLNLGDSYAAGKNLVGIPWRVAFALQADSWYLRQDIIWHKPNPMPESVTDRCTKAHEYIFMLSKSPNYYYDADAIREEAKYKGVMRGGSTCRYEQNNFGGDNKEYDTRNKRSVWTVNPKPYPESHFAVFPEALIMPCVKAGSAAGDTVLDPFSGSGTTGVVALKLDRKFVGIDLNAEYCKMARNRIGKETNPATHRNMEDSDGPLFTGEMDSAQ